MAEVTTAHKWLQLPDEVVAAYNAWDCLATVRAHKALLHYLRKNGQLDFYNQEVWPLIPVVQAMQRRGLPYDMAAKTRYRRRLRAELRTWDERLRTLYAETMRTSARWPDIEKARELVPWFLGSERPEGKPPMTKAAWKKLTKYVPEPLYDTTQGQPLLSFNLGSDYHLRDWLFNGLKLKPSTQTETKLPSVDQDALNRILGQLRARRKTPPGFAEASPEEQWELLPTDEKVLCGLMHRARLVKIDTDYLDPEVCYEPDGNGQVGDLPDDILAHKPGDTTFDGLRGGRGGSVQQPIRYRNRAEPVDLRRDIGAVQVGGRRGRVFPRIKLTGTESGRFSYADPPVHSWPDEIRHLVAPGPGYCIVGADARAIEARVFALEVGDEALIELFERNAQDPENPEFDLHIRNACDLFDWTLEEFLSFSPRKQKASRNTAKSFQYGVVQYGGQPTTAKTKVSCPCPWCADKVPPSLRLSPAEKERQAQRWFARHPRTYFWRAEVSRELAQRKALTNRFGRKRYFAEPYRRGSHVEREGWNWKIQSSAVDIINRALRALHEEGVALILQHHDGLYAEAPEGEAPTIEARMRRAMQKPVPEYGGFVFPVEVHSGPNWGELA